MTLKDTFIDTAALANLIAVALNFLPQATIVLTFVWAVLRIWESKTVQKWVNRNKKFNRRREDKI